MNLKTEQLLFCIICIAFVLLIVFIEEPYEFIVFPVFLVVLFWTSKFMKLARESKQEKP